MEPAVEAPEPGSAEMVEMVVPEEVEQVMEVRYRVEIKIMVTMPQPVVDTAGMDPLGLPWARYTFKGM